MKSVLITFDQAYYERIMALLDRLNCRGFTYLEKVQAPTLLFWGEQDTAAPLWVAQAMEKRMPDAGLVAMPGVGHFAYLDRYADFRAVLDNFIS